MKRQPSHKPDKNTAFLPPRRANLAAVRGGDLGCVGYVEQPVDSHSLNLTMFRLDIETGSNREGRAWITMGKMAAQTLNVQGGISA